MSFYTGPGYDELLNAIDDEGGVVPCQQWPDLFFPDMGGTSEPAKKLCQGCPVMLQCLAYAIKADEPYGVWGGASVLERKRIKNNARRAAR